MTVTNTRKIQRWLGDSALTFSPLVNGSGSTILVDYANGHRYRVDGAVFNSLVEQQTAERVAAGHAAPAIVQVPLTCVALVS
jgi:hypothetical protein